jgi:hypothetical protein
VTAAEKLEKDTEAYHDDHDDDSDARRQGSIEGLLVNYEKLRYRSFLASISKLPGSLSLPPFLPPSLRDPLLARTVKRADVSR